MRLRKQAKSDQAPGDTFLRAVSSGRAARPPAPPPATDDGALRQQLLDTQQRAEAAEEALRQIREESQLRLEEAREALSAERAARVAAEESLSHSERPSVAPEPHDATEPDAAVGDATAEDERPHPSEGPPLRDAIQSAPGEEEEWPTPWLEQGKRRFFYR